jgi:hypothetical protein
MSRQRGKLLRLTGALALVIAGGFVVSSQSAAAGGPKTYTAAATTPTLQPGAQPAGITLTNTSRNKIAFNGVNLAVPAGLTISGPLTLEPAVGTATLNGSTIELRSLNTAAGDTVTVGFTVTPQPQPTCAPRTFTADVRQSNDFNGTLNVFTLDGPPASMSGPCSSATITCTAADSAQCATGTIVSAGGNTASVVVNDGDSISGTLSASVATGALQCAEYNATSDQLDFGINVTAGSTAGVTKTVTFTQPQTDLTKQDWEYQACFQAPYDFPALRPSELAHDFATNDYAGNTVEAPAGTFTGLLLPCSAQQGVPCLVSRSITAGVVSITVDVPALDPGLKF